MISYRKNLIKATSLANSGKSSVKVIRIANERFLQGVKEIVRNLLTSLETSNVGRHKITMSIKILGMITTAFMVN